MTRDQLSARLASLVPTGAEDTSSVSAIARLCDADLEMLAPSLIEWLQDPRWPVARALEPVLAARTSPLVPAVATVLAGDDPVWQENVITTLVDSMADEDRVGLAPLLRAVAEADDVDGAAQAARATIDLDVAGGQ